jgi:two-component system chemotaxis response regulator CheB
MAQANGAPELPEKEQAVTVNGKQPNHASGITCPECHGSLWEVEDGGLVRYQCRVDHSFSPENLVEDQARAVEAAVWSAVNVLEERAALLRRMASQAGGLGAERASRFEEQSREAQQQADLIHEVLLGVLRSEAPGNGPAGGAPPLP